MRSRDDTFAGRTGHATGSTPRILLATGVRSPRFGASIGNFARVLFRARAYPRQAALRSRSGAGLSAGAAARSGRHRASDGSVDVADLPLAEAQRAAGDARVAGGSSACVG